MQNYYSQTNQIPLYEILNKSVINRGLYIVSISNDNGIIDAKRFIL